MEMCSCISPLATEQHTQSKDSYQLQFDILKLLLAWAVIVSILYSKYSHCDLYFTAL